MKWFLWRIALKWARNLGSAVVLIPSYTALIYIVPPYADLPEATLKQAFGIACLLFAILPESCTHE